MGDGEDLPKFGGGKRDDRGVDPEDSTLAHDLHVSIFEVERLVASERLFITALPDVIAQLGWGQVGYGGDAQCGGGYRTSCGIGESVRKGPHQA